MLTQSRLKKIVRYNPETGIFTRKGQCKGRASSRPEAGHKSNRGYVMISVDGKSYPAHRLAFLYMSGSFPKDEVDHKNGYPHDNRWENLREVSHTENCMNQKRRSDNTSGFPGVSWHNGRRKWQAMISIAGKRSYLGLFRTREEAHSEYASVAIRLGFTDRHIGFSSQALTPSKEKAETAS